MSRMYRGKEIFKPLNTGWIDKNVACVREWVANIFFYCKDNAVIMIDAGYNYDRLAEKMGWLGIAPQSVQHILITHQDTDHVGAVEADSIVWGVGIMGFFPKGGAKLIFVCKSKVHIVRPACVSGYEQRM